MKESINQANNVNLELVCKQCVVAYNKLEIPINKNNYEKKRFTY